MRVNTNVSAFNAQRNLTMAGMSLAKSVEKLSSGLRINRAADDAAGLSTSEKLRGQIRGLNQAVRNAQDGISLIQTAEGALNESHSILQRMRELAVQASSDTSVLADREGMGAELAALNDELNRIAQTTEFNTMKLLDGTFTGKVFQIGANATQTIAVAINDAQTANIGNGANYTGPGGVGTAASLNAAVTTYNTPVTGFTQGQATDMLKSLDVAIADVSKSRSALGAVQNRLEHTIANLSVASENLVASESRIRDADMASEMVTYTKTSILQQAGTSILAQANQAPQSVLSLLR
jgi:flagellin